MLKWTTVTKEEDIHKGVFLICKIKDKIKYDILMFKYDEEFEHTVASTYESYIGWEEVIKFAEINE